VYEWLLKTDRIINQLWCICKNGDKKWKRSDSKSIEGI